MIHRLLVVGTGLLWCLPVWADVTVIYRKSDRLVVAWVHPPHSVEQEITNITQSELGGRPEDYATVTVPEAQWTKQDDEKIVVDGAGTVVFVPNPH
jgi:hypothetical protein